MIIRIAQSPPASLLLQLREPKLGYLLRDLSVHRSHTPGFHVE